MPPDPPIDGRADASQISHDSQRDPDAWDANDARRQKDQFAPPAEPCECYCLHCQRTFMSDGIWFQKVIGARDGFQGFWMCPTPNCSGAGFTFDIFPTDENHPANAGWQSFDDEEYEEDFDPDDFDDAVAEGSNNEEYDSSESKWKRFDEDTEDDSDDDMEGEEWKHGLQPGERPAMCFGSDEGRRAWEEEQKKYDMPDERPREVDWSDREDRDSTIGEDEIPF